MGGELGVMKCVMQSMEHMTVICVANGVSQRLGVSAHPMGLAEWELIDCRGWHVSWLAQQYGVCGLLYGMRRGRHP
jgi:hypothetical protein